jgi:cardiolipin synthase
MKRFSKFKQIKYENIYTIPNFLSLSRLTVSPFIGYSIIMGNHDLALGSFIFAGITDLLDGQIARKYKSQRSFVGSILDPLADKTLVTTVVACLSYTNDIPPLLGATIISRDIFLVTAATYYRYKTLPNPVIYILIIYRKRLLDFLMQLFRVLNSGQL